MYVRPHRALVRLGFGLVVWMAVLGLAAQPALAKEYLLGLMCDRSGPTGNIGKLLCDGFHDYIKLDNYKQGLPDGHTIRVMEIDHGYNVPRGVEAYQRFIEAGAISLGLYGTPVIIAVAKNMDEDQISGSVPGLAAFAADGEKYPYIFPASATYWSQAAASVRLILDKWDGKAPPKIAYLFYDNPAGREPLPILHAIQEKEGFTLREFAVPPPGIEMRPQVLDIARRYRADWVLIHTFGRASGVALKELIRAGFPRDRMVGMVWAGTESDIEVAGWESTQGYYTLQIAHVGSSRKNPNHPLLKEIVDMYTALGEEQNNSMDYSVMYNRGLMWGAFHAEGLRLAIEQYGADATRDEVRRGLESIRGFGLNKFMPPMTITAKDHEGGGYVRFFQVKGRGFVPASEWMHGYRDIVLEHLAELSKLK